MSYLGIFHSDEFQPSTIRPQYASSSENVTNIEHYSPLSKRISTKINELGYRKWYFFKQGRWEYFKYKIDTNLLFYSISTREL